MTATLIGPSNAAMVARLGAAPWNVTCHIACHRSKNPQRQRPRCSHPLPEDRAPDLKATPEHGTTLRRENPLAPTLRRETPPAPSTRYGVKFPPRL